MTISAIGHYRWTICALLFFASIFIYLLLKPVYALLRKRGMAKTPAAVYGDRTRVAQVVMNLLGNAKHSIKESNPRDRRIRIGLGRH